MYFTFDMIFEEKKIIAIQYLQKPIQHKTISIKQKELRYIPLKLLA